MTLIQRLLIVNVPSLFFIQAFKEKKCRLQCENLTRWSSSFLMLESVKRAYEKGAFNGKVNKCAYENWNLSSNISTSISSVVRFSKKFNFSCRNDVLMIIKRWKKLDLLAIRMKLCQHLIACVKYEFHSEINSPTYQVWFSKSLFYLDK